MSFRRSINNNNNNNNNNNGGRSTSSSSSSRPRVLDKVWNSFRSGRNAATTTTTERGAIVVGTHALALQRMDSNQDRFKYPKEGFVTPIEHSLLYAMICEPKIYPESVVLEHISNEDFQSYLEVSDDRHEERVSYAQLSALLAQSAEKFPNVKPQKQQESHNNDKDEDDSSSQQQLIPQALCRAVLSCVTKYADQHDLDRATEVKELLEPVEQYMMGSNATTLLPIYIAYSVGIFIPGGVGLGLTVVALSAMIAASEKADQNAQTVQKMNSQRHRVADMETAGLLDEVEGY
jgi:hypothetical protein